MTISLKHAFTNPKSDGGDATVVRPSNWNAEHALTMAADRVLGRVTAGDGVAEELNAEQMRTLLNVSEAGVLGAINTQTGNYTLQLSDYGDVVEMNSSGANTVTVPTNAAVAFPIGSQITVIQFGAGQTTIAPAAGVTLFAMGGALKASARYAAISLYKRNTNQWVVFGSLSV